MNMFGYSWADDDFEEAEPDADESQVNDEPPDLQQWTDEHSEELVTVYHKLKDETYLTGVLSNCSLNDMCHAIYHWTWLGPMYEDMPYEDASRLSLGIIHSLYSEVTRSGFAIASLEEFTHFCLRHSDSRLL